MMEFFEALHFFEADGSVSMQLRWLLMTVAFASGAMALLPVKFPTWIWRILCLWALGLLLGFSFLAALWHSSVELWLDVNIWWCVILAVVVCFFLQSLWKNKKDL